MVWGRCMDDWAIRQEIAIAAGQDAVWRCVADPERLSRWYCAGGPVKVRFEPRKGSRFEEHYDDGEHAYDIEGVIWSFDQPRRLLIRREAVDPSVSADFIDIRLDEQNQKTRVVIEHSFENLAPRKREAMEEFYSDGWAAALRTLRDMST